MTYPKQYPHYVDLKAALPEIDSDYLNVVIDLKTYFLQYYYQSYRYVGKENEDIENIVVKIINSISHYRNYFYKEKRLPTKFFILYSCNKCENLLKIIPKYKQRIYEKFDNILEYNSVVISKSLQLINDIINRIPGCVFIDTSDYDENAYIKAIIENTDQVTMIVTSYDNELFPTLDNKSFMLNSKTDSLTIKTFDVLEVIKSIIIGSDIYGLKSSWCSEEKFEDSWRTYIEQNQLYNPNTVNNPIDYKKIESRIKSKPSIDKSILTYKDVQNFNYDIMSGNMLYYNNKHYLDSKIVDYYTNEKMSRIEAEGLNDIFIYNKIQVNGLYRLINMSNKCEEIE